CNMVKAGEAGGVLDVVLDRVAMFMEKSIRTAKKVKAAMIYPAVVMVVAVGIVALLMVVVVPKFQGIFQQMLKGAPMPGPTPIVIGVSNFFVDQKWLALGVIIASVFSVMGIKRSKKGSRALDWLGIKLPKFGDVIVKSNVARITRTFGTLLESGVPILQALLITRETISNSFFADAMTKMHDAVRDGEPLATPMAQQAVFPTMVTSMVEIGEETGELPDMLNRIADNYDEDIDNAVAALTSIIEPIMIVFLAVVVGFIVIALFLPIVSIIETLGK
ncbi:MAG: type II secretion system F family protein, partial [Opitutales bacterium]